MMAHQGPKKGLFITVEGIEGAGKSTLVDFLQSYLAQQHIPCLVTREPGGTARAEAIRCLLLSEECRYEPMRSDTELLLLCASRAQHVAHVIAPALNQGYWVICDRFSDASFAYQGGGRRVSLVRIAQLNSWVAGYVTIDYTLLLDLPVADSVSRLRQRAAHSIVTDRIERADTDFFERVRAVYLKRAYHEPKRFRIIDARQAFAAVTEQVIAHVNTWIKAHHAR